MTPQFAHVNAKHALPIVCFDLDGTLVETDKANNLAYAKALRWVLGNNITLPSESGQRFEQKDLQKYFAHLSSLETQQIVSYKGLFYGEYLDETHVNKCVLELLKSVADHNLTLLITKANMTRAAMLLKYHQLNDYFQSVFSFTATSQFDNKYVAAFNRMGIRHFSGVQVIDNELRELKHAAAAGVQQQNLFLV
jgi:phosphoglycolate phosphatase-like HAD superfamily hydrolase